MQRLKPVLGVMAVLGSVGLAWALAIVLASGERGELTHDGFVANWLLLAPIPLEPHQYGTRGLDVQAVKDEAQLKPRPGDRVVVNGRELVWRTYRVKDDYFDFNDFLGQTAEHSVGYAVCYIHTRAAMKDIMLLTGSDDQAKIILNGKEAFRYNLPRGLTRDQDTIPIQLEKGVNVLIFKVVNERLFWQGCARFVSADGRIMMNIAVTTTPDPPAWD
jgi:hypothetical protein